MIFKELLYRLLPNKKKVIPKGIAGGALKHKVDKRDLKTKLPGGTVAPDDIKFSVRSKVTQVEDQGLYNSCVAHAVTTSLETYSLNNNWPHPFELSRMYVWHYGRKLSNTYPDNSGMYIRDAWKVVQGDDGVTIEKLYPYSNVSYNKEPGLAARIFRKWHTPFKYMWIDGTKADKETKMKFVLKNYQVPIVFGIGLSDSFFRPEKTASFVYKPNDNEVVKFYHAMTITGWDDEKNAFEILNSWGTRWGRNGYLLVDKDWLLSKGFSLSYPIGDNND